MIKAGVDHIVLGCSHYPYLIPTIKRLIPEHINIIDSGFAVARQTQAILAEQGLLRHDHNADQNRNKGTAAHASELSAATLQFWTNSDPKPLKQILNLNEQNNDKVELDLNILQKDF